NIPNFLGDALYNMRCALDHVAWYLVKVGADPNPKRPTDVQFPIYDTPQEFHNNVGRLLPGVDKATIQFIESRQKYMGWKAPHYPLSTLKKLSNDDKHRTLHTIVCAVWEAKFKCKVTNGKVVRDFLPIEPVRFESGAEVLTLEIAGPRPETQV